MLSSTWVGPDINFKLRNVDFVDRGRAREPEIDLPSNPSSKIVWTPEPFASKYDLRVDFIDRGRARDPEINLPSNPPAKIVWTPEPVASKSNLRVDFIDRGRARAKSSAARLKIVSKTSC